MGVGLGARAVSRGGRFTLGGETNCCTLGDSTVGGISTLGVGSAGTDGGRGGRRRDNGVGGGGGNGGIGGNVGGRGDRGESELVPASQSLAGHILVPSLLGAGTLCGAGTKISGLDLDWIMGVGGTVTGADKAGAGDWLGAVTRRRSLAIST